MPNKNYVKGRRKEYKICDELRAQGWDIVQRTAGSHSPIDVIAINQEKKLIRLIQSKPDDFGIGKTQSIIRQNWWLNGNFLVEFVVE